jgi:Ohr subfamily peroxiredoxin
VSEDVGIAARYISIQFSRFPQHRGYFGPANQSSSIRRARRDPMKDDPMTKIDKVLYTGKTHTTGGRDGYSKSSDGELDIRLSPPGSTNAGTNPEQLFAAGWSACFLGALGIAAAKRKIKLPDGITVDAEVDLGTSEDGYLLQARLNVSLQGIERDVAEALVAQAHQTCPYSKATRGNIYVELSVA